MPYLVALLFLFVQTPEGKKKAGGTIKALQENEATPKWLVGPAHLKSPGGELPFVLEIDVTSQHPVAWVVNGEERARVPSCTFPRWTDLQRSSGPKGQPQSFEINFEHFDATLTGTVKIAGDALPTNMAVMRADEKFELRGEWRKRRGADQWATLPFFAELNLKGTPSQQLASIPVDSPIAGKWSVKFGSETTPSVGDFKTLSPNRVSGTFLSSTGDYGFLNGVFDGKNLQLSSFDGAHALLFKAGLQSDGTLSGDFWASDKHHEKWTAKPDPSATLPDPLKLSKVNESVKLADLVFPDVEGNRKSLNDPAFAGKARIIEVFGTWCPNCHDEAPFLAELDAKYHDRGLRIVSLAFELTGDEKRDAKQVKTYVERHNIKYPVLIAGTRDKEKAAVAFPLLEQIVAYPTTIFLQADGKVKAVHTGFSGPATGEEHQKLRKEFERIIEELLGPPGK